MIHDAMNLLRSKLNAYIKLKAGINEDKVRFLDGSNFDPIQFPLDYITPIIVNIHEERTLRQYDYYQPKIVNGLQTERSPEINIQLIVLFVSRFRQYDQGLMFLSMIIRFFQSNITIDKNAAPELNEDIDRLHIEMLTMSISEQNDLWNALRVCYLPSVAFKVGMFTYKDTASVAAANEMSDISINANRK